jgi:hypothetical protein
VVAAKVSLSQSKIQKEKGMENVTPKSQTNQGMVVAKRGRPLSAKAQQILQLLAEYRFLTTGQLHQKLGNRQVELTRKQLGSLKKRELIGSFACNQELGRTSENGWLLKRKGAELLSELSGVKLNYNTHYLRPPSQERLQFREYELELERQVARAGWQLIKPQSYNQFKPLPKRTAQYYALAEALTIIEARRNGGGVSLDPQGPHTLIVPLKANDYVARSQDGTKAIVLILSPVRAGEQFWQTRVKQYRLLARELNVVGVFASEEAARQHKSQLEPHKLKVTTLDRVSKGLVGLK